MTGPVAAAVKSHSAFLDPAGIKVIDRWTFLTKFKTPISAYPFFSELARSFTFTINKKAVPFRWFQITMKILSVPVRSIQSACLRRTTGL